MQVCPYDCRHTLATISSHVSQSINNNDNGNGQHPQQQLEVYVYETEAEGLARHMLLIALLFDPSFTAQIRAEMFLELHGNTLLRQQTADWVCKLLLGLRSTSYVRSVIIKLCTHPRMPMHTNCSHTGMTQQSASHQASGRTVLSCVGCSAMSSCSVRFWCQHSPPCAMYRAVCCRSSLQTTRCCTATSTLTVHHVVLHAGAASRCLEAAVAGHSEKQQQAQQQQQQTQPQNPAEAVLRVFDLSVLKYKEKDALLETFQHYRCGMQW